MTIMPDPKRQNYQNTVHTGYGLGNNLYATQYASRNQAGHSYGMHHKPNHDLASLTHSFQGVSIQNRAFAGQAENAMIGHAANGYPGLTGVPALHAGLYNATGQYVYPAAYATGNNPQSPSMYSPQTAHHIASLGYGGYRHENSPVSTNWTPTTVTAAEVPTLVTPRRDSVSSNENDQPTTPMYTSYASYAHHAGMPSHRSPGGMYTHNTPSPTAMISSYALQMTKPMEHSDLSPHIKMLLAKDPPIPRAIPAPSSPLKPLDRALENQRGETNVYIRGLLPETTDEQLEAWGSRFGDIKSSKSIIDLNTGQCKGYGFVKYHNYEDAENCIRGFHHLGYEVSFARESFYSKLKTFADESNTNLYVSNLPKSMNEHELANLFEPHKVCSSRILRDKNGHGRGVGFARFESRDVCEEVIKTFNNHTIKTGDEELQIQIRFADTQEQKALKQQTQAARQFRSQEYEYATAAWREGRLPHVGTTNHGNATANEFDQYLGTSPSVPIHNQRWAQLGLRTIPGRSPLGGVPLNTSSTPTPLVQISVTPGSEDQHPSDAGGDAKPSTASTLTGPNEDLIDSANASEQE